MTKSKYVDVGKIGGGKIHEINNCPPEIILQVE